MPLNSSLTRIKGTGDQFRLVVPPISLHLPGLPLVEVSPVVFAQVLVDSNEVSIQSNECIIGGSELIQKFKINDFFEFQVKILLTWNDGVGATSAATSAATSTLNDYDNQGPSIRAQSEIQIDLDPPGPFAFVPKHLTESVGNRAIQMTLGALQKNFMQSLGDDFERWAVDEQYRLERQQLELDFLQEDEIDMGLGGRGDFIRRGEETMAKGVKVEETLSAYLNL